MFLKYINNFDVLQHLFYLKKKISKLFFALLNNNKKNKSNIYQFFNHNN